MAVSTRFREPFQGSTIGRQGYWKDGLESIYLVDLTGIKKPSQFSQYPRSNYFRQ